MKRLVGLLLTLCMLMSLSITSFASQATASIEITYRDILITLDGSEIVPVDANGNYTEPFIFDGTTYLPVRGVASALGLNVTWDDATSTAELTSGGKLAENASPAAGTEGTQTKTATYRDIKITIDGNEISPKDANGNIVEPFIIDGTTYLPVRAIAEALGLSVAWEDQTNTVVLSSDVSDTTPGNDSGVYIGSVDSDKFHIPGCRFADNILPENAVWFDSAEEAMSAGYVPCGVCNP